MKRAGGEAKQRKLGYCPSSARIPPAKPGSYARHGIGVVPQQALTPAIRIDPSSPVRSRFESVAIRGGLKVAKIPEFTFSYSSFFVRRGHGQWHCSTCGAG